MQESGEKSLQALIAEVKQRTAEYEWMAAADYILEARPGLETERETVPTARLTEVLADCYLRGAFQAESREQFKERMLRARQITQANSQQYESLGLKADAKKTEARVLYASFWLEENVSKQRDLLKKSIALDEEALSQFEAEQSVDGIAEVIRDLLTYLEEIFPLVEEWNSVQTSFEKVVRYGEKALAVSGSMDEIQLDSLGTCLRVMAEWSEYVPEASQVQEFAKKAMALEARIGKIAEKTRTPFSSYLANAARGKVLSAYEGNASEALKANEASLEFAGKLKDTLLLGWLFLSASIAAFWSGWPEDDVERGSLLLEKGIEYASRAVRCLEIPRDLGSIADAYHLIAECHDALGFSKLADVEEKRSRVLKAIEFARREVSYVGYTRRGAGHPLSKALWVLASMTSEPAEKRRLLEEALALRKETVQTMDRMAPHAWDRGVMRNYLALLKADLADLESTRDSKIQLLKEAVSDSQECIKYCREWATKPSYIGALAGYCSWYSDILMRLYTLTQEEATGRLCIEAHEAAISYWTQLGLPGRSAEETWELAKMQDALGDYQAAARTFKKAAEDYTSTVKKIPRMESSIREVESYMRAWALIEEARILHKGENYAAASEKYRKVVDLLKTTRTWSHLATHYEACSFLEEADAQSHQERLDLSLKSFSNAAETFRVAKDVLAARLVASHDHQEQAELREWANITDSRMQFCYGRGALEEAKVLDKGGEKNESLAKYVTASEVFERLLREAKDEQSRRELETLLLFCEAWMKMKEAEMKSSADLYREASERFTKAEKAATTEKSRLLALGNAALCGALESGTSFKRTRDPKLYTEIKRKLEAAADSYEEGGFKNEAEWTRATQRLFDALLYLADAEAEREAKKKTELYHLAEKHLEFAAKHYGEAGFPRKRDEALRHLERAREEKELLLTPMEALAESPAASGASVASVAPVSLTRDQALGSERYEGANVVGNLSVGQSEMNIGDDLTLEFELANIGANPALLVKLENIVPEGFELQRDRIQHRVEDSFINMKGRRLDHLKTDEVKVPLKALRKGSFELRPRILFVDEKGNYKSYEFEPASLTVGELGISGWIKGKRK